MLATHILNFRLILKRFLMHKYILLLILFYFVNIEINAQDIQSNSNRRLNIN